MNKKCYICNYPIAGYSAKVITSSKHEFTMCGICYEKIIKPCLKTKEKVLTHENITQDYPLF